ncbi:MAG: RNA polymerase sigma factor FliA [Sphingobium sp.]
MRSLATATQDTGLTYGRRAAGPSPDQLARQYMPIVRKIAWHVHGRVSNAIDIEDLLQIGMVALVEAANAFEDRGHGFASYAQLRVRGAMIDHLRRNATICRSAMARRKQIGKARDMLQQRTGRVPSEQEIATVLGLNPDQWRELTEGTEIAQVQSMDEVYSDQSMWFADVEDRADDILERESLKKAVAACIAELPQREGLVLQLYFVEEMNLDEIGQTLDIGAARVCQIKKAALDKLRARLAEWAD